MKTVRKIYFRIATVTTLCLVSYSTALGQETSQFTSEIKLSYSFFDQEGKRSTVEDVYNLYSGFALSQLGFGAAFNNGSFLNFNSANANLGNRNISLDFRRNNWLSFKVGHQESRFFFGENQENSERKTSSAIFWVSPLKALKLYADYSYQKKEGDRIAIIEDTPGVLGTRYDQFLQRGQVGVQLNSKRNFVSYSYRILDFDSRIDEAFDRRSNRHQVVVSSSMPKDFYLSFQYLKDDAELKQSNLNLDTDLFTFAALYRAFRGFSLSGKFSYQSTDNEATALTSKVLKNSYNVVYDFNKRIGIEAGYEYERRKDEDGQNNLNSFLIGAKTLPRDNLRFKASYLKKERKDKDLSTLAGPYDSDNFLFNLNYKPVQKLTLDLKYQDRQRDNEEILTSTDSKGFTSFGSFVYNDRVGADATFSALNIEYQDTFGHFFNNTRNLLLSGWVKPVAKLTLSGGFTYLRVKGDQDLSKEDVMVGAEYVLWKDFSAEFRYSQYNLDDYLLAPDYYTLNVFTISLSQKLSKL